MKKIWVDYLRALALIGVITIHSTAKAFRDFGNINMLDWWISNVLNTSFRFAVPMFVMISGCLLLGRNIGVKEFFIKRGLRLLPAFVFWSIFYIIFGELFAGKGLSVFYFFKKLTYVFIISGQAHYHLWYLSMYICLMVFAPFINNYILAKRPNSEDFFYMFFAFAFFMSLNQFSTIGSIVFEKNMFWFKSFPWFIGYFILGYAVDVFNEKIFISDRITILLIGFILVASWIFNFYLASDQGLVLDYFVLLDRGILNFILTLLIFYFFSKNKNKFKHNTFISKVSSISFGIYLIHAFFLDIINRYITSYLESPTVSIFILIGLTFAFSYFTINSLSKIRWFRMVCQ